MRVRLREQVVELLVAAAAIQRDNAQTAQGGRLAGEAAVHRCSQKSIRQLSRTAALQGCPPLSTLCRCRASSSSALCSR